MWEIYSKTWGKLNATDVYESSTFVGMLTLHGVSREGKSMWVEAYIPARDISLITHKEN